MAKEYFGAPVAGYVGLISAGFNVLSGLMGDPVAETQAYNTAYATAQEKSNAMNRMATSTRNMARVKMSSIKKRTVIGQRQDEAEAQARVSAAVAGSGGQSVQDVVDMTTMNAAMRVGEVNSQEENDLSALSVDVYNAASGLSLQEQEYDSDLWGTTLTAIGSAITPDTLERVGVAWEDHTENTRTQKVRQPTLDFR